MEDLTKTIMFTTNALQNGAPTTIQYQTSDGTLKPKIEGQKSQEFPTFCYTTNVNKIQMLTPTSQGHSTVNLAQLSDDSKTCYIAQPFGYANYALVNQMQMGAAGTVAGIATVDSSGRIQVVNKPITNTISNISFKCDVCGLMFSHLTLLNHHKRIHNQDGSDTNNDQITVVTQSQNIVQAQNIVNENGQSLGQIQIVATEALEPATTQALQQVAEQQQQQQVQQIIQQQQHQQQQQQQQVQHHQQQQAQSITITTTKVNDKTSKCITCGASIPASTKRKGPKLIRCENCINNDNATHIQSRQTATQIFVAPDGDVKFEMSEIPSAQSDSMDSIGSQNNIMPVTTTSSGSSNSKHSQQQQNQSGHILPGYYPVKKRNLAAVTKCNKCNGSGVIYIGGQKPAKAGQQEQQKPFHCNICGGSFSRYSSLWSHKKLHSGEKNYKCSICGLAFAKAVYLKNHSRIHTGEKPYKCATCGMQFSQSPHLKNHERTHSGEKPYVCEVCDKGFARHATLWNHRRIHTGEKPYKCDICGSAFSQAAHLKNHAKVHSGEKPFKCDICSAAFADRFALKRHRQIHEKYGQTAPRQPAQVPMEVQIVHKQELPEIEEEDEDNVNEVIISGL